MKPFYEIVKILESKHYRFTVLTNNNNHVFVKPPFVIFVGREKIRVTKNNLLATVYLKIS